MATQPPGGPKDDTRVQLMQMRSEIDRVVATVNQLVTAQAVENVLMNGFSDLTGELHRHLKPLADLPAQLQPLAALAPPPRTQMEPAEKERLAAVRRELARESWVGPGTPGRSSDDGSPIYLST